MKQGCGRGRKCLLRNQISTSEHVITGKGECNDKLPPLRQADRRVYGVSNGISALFLRRGRAT